METLTSELNSLLKDHQLYHSEFQQDWLITARAGGNTLYGQYKQALRELFKRKRGLQELYCARERLRIDLAELKDKAIAAEKYELARVDIDITEKTFGSEDLERNIQDTEREFIRFFQQAKYLKDQLGEITPERRKVLDEGMWEERLNHMAAVDFITSGRLSTNTIEFIWTLPKEKRTKMLLQVQDHKSLMNKIESNEIVGMTEFVDSKDKLDVCNLQKALLES